MKKQKGITLIALIITIIVMLILVGVSVSVALNTGLFKTAQGVAKNTQIASEEETAISNGTISIGGEKIKIDDYINQLSIDLSGIKVGDIIEYTPASNYTSSAKYSVPAQYTGCSGSFYTDMGEDVEWKVIGVEGKTIKIIPNTVSTATLTLEGANGWNNSIDVLNSVCGAIYGNTTSEKYTATAKSLTVEDINGITGYNPENSGVDNASDYAQYNANYFPTEYLEEKGIENITEIAEGCGYATNSTITVENTYYSYIDAETQPGFNAKFTGWIGLDRSYYLASRCVRTSGVMAQFGVFAMGHVRAALSLGISVNSYTPETSEPGDFYIRPVVSLTPKVTPTIAETKDGINYWTFETN